MSEDVSPWAAVWRCLGDFVFSRFGAIPACDRRTDGRTHRRTNRQWRAIAYRASIASRYNNRENLILTMVSLCFNVDVLLQLPVGLTTDGGSVFHTLSRPIDLLGLLLQCGLLSL